MNLREANPDDAERVREVADSSMTTSYALSPQQIGAIVEDQFGEERLSRELDRDDALLLVAEDDVDGETTVLGVVAGGIDGETGEIRWLFVDPEHRGHGIGTELFETAVERLRDGGAERVRALTLEANTEGAQFFERFEFERTDERGVELGDESLVEYIYADPSTAEGTADSAETNADEADSTHDEFPDAEIRDGAVVATTGDGREVYVDRDDEESGTEAPFFPAYDDEAFSEQFGYYCANCGSLDVALDDMDRMECGNCGNSHASRSSESYDDSYL